MTVVMERPKTKTYIRTPIIKKEYKRYDIWMAEVREGKGHEQVGVRPVCLISNNLGNYHSPVVIVAPLTTSTTKAKLPTHVYLKGEENGLNADSIVLTEQIVTIDKSRLKYKISTLGYNSKKELDAAIITSLGLVN